MPATAILPLITAAGAFHRANILRGAAFRARLERDRTICVAAGILMPGSRPYSEWAPWYASAAATVDRSKLADVPTYREFLAIELREVWSRAQLLKARAAARRLVIAATEIADGEIVVCQGDVFGPVLARFPRTSDGRARAENFVRTRIAA